MVKKDTYIKKVGPSQFFTSPEKEPLLVSLDMELTERCNNNCIHCSINLPAEDSEAQAKELRTSEVKAILKEAVELGCLSVRFTGGEPLLRDDFEELYVYARKLGLQVVIFTNATLISPELAQLFARIPPLFKIEVTVYGMTRQSYEAVTRTPGSFEAAFRGMNLLLERKVPFVVKAAVLPPNRNELAMFEAWAASLPGMEKPPLYTLSYSLRVRGDQERNRMIKKNRLSAREILTVLLRQREEFLKDMVGFCFRFMKPRGKKLFDCYAGQQTGCIDAYGFAYPCLLLKHPETAFDLRNGSLKDALTVFFPKVIARKARDPEYLNRCSRCFLMGFCEQCPGRSWAEHGDLDRPVDYLCQGAHTQAEYWGLLRNGEKAWEVKGWKTRTKSLASLRRVFGKKGAEKIQKSRWE